MGEMKLSINELQEGMKLSQTINVPFTDVEFIQAGIVLDAATIDIIKGLGVTEALVFDGVEEAPADGTSPGTVTIPGETAAAASYKYDFKILIIDDEPDICNYVKDVFETKGFETMIALNVNDAWKSLVNDDKIKKVFLDISMPETDGFVLLGRIKKELGRDIDITMVTARKTLSDVVMAKELGAVDYITKPFNSERLLHSIELVKKKNDGDKK